MSKTVVKPRHNGTIKPADEPSPLKNGRGHSCSPLKRLKPSEDADAPTAGDNPASPGAGVDSDDAELARKLHEQLNGPDSPTAAPITRHITRVRKAPTFYKPEQPRGYGGYHGTEGGQEPEGVQEREEGPAEASPRHVKENHIPREQHLHDHSLSLSDTEAKSTHPRRTRASSVPDPTSATAPPRRQLATQSADQGVNKKRSDVKTEEDVEMHSRSGPRQRSKQRSSTPELRLTRSMQPPAELQPPHNPPADQRRTGRSLPVKLEEQGATGEQAALHQGSSGSPGKGAGSSSQPEGQAAKRRGSKAVGKDADAAVKAEVTSSRLRQSTAGGSTSGESQSHVDLAAACQDQGDAMGGSGRRNSDGTAVGVSKRAKLPAKNPMVLQKQNGSYYRVRVLEEKAHQVKIEFMGFEQQLQPVWLARDSERIWRGSYKNKAWKHLGDGAWEPRCGEKRAPAVAHGTHQNQYTKRRALLNCTSNHTSSNNDSDDNMVGSDDGTQRDQQHGHFAETGFAAQTSAGADEKGDEQAKGSNAAAQDADSGKAEATLPVGESGVLSRQQGGESSGMHKGRAYVSSDESKKSRRRKQNLRDADASSGDKTIPMDTDEAAEGSAQPHRRKEASLHTHQRASRATASTATPVAAHAVTDRLPSRKSGEEEEGLIDGAGAEMRGAAPGAAVDQCATATSIGEDVMQADQPSAKGSAEGTGAAGLQSDSDPTEAATSSGIRHSKDQAGPLAPQQKAGSSKGQSGLEAALQCEEHLADDVAAPPGVAGTAAAAAPDAATDAATKAAEEAPDDKAKAVEAEAAPKPLVKPRRDRKGRIRGTYGINAKPVEVQTPTESPPAPGVTRASLRPKPVAKAPPDDEQSEGAKPTAAAPMRHARAASAGPDAGGAAPESPGSPQHSKGPVPEARRPSGRSAIQRRAAAANFAVAAAVAAEAADAIPMTRDHPSRASSQSQHNHRRLGGLGPSKTGLDHVISGRITKTVSGGSSGGGSSGGSARFSSLMDALGDMEARQGSFRPQQQSQQLRPTRTLSLGEPNVVPSSGATQRPALFDRGFVSRWHEPVGPVSPSILTLSSDLFQLGPSPFVPESWNAASLCHSSLHAGHGIQPQYPLFKTRECAG